MYKIKHENS
uniref:Uncharacterized protein n=1 Tax=Anguilla anguilla TaxID=7936 RepID=A0A0E9QB96_ANGAN